LKIENYYTSSNVIYIPAVQYNIHYMYNIMFYKKYLTLNRIYFRSNAI